MQFLAQNILNKLTLNPNEKVKVGEQEFSVQIWIFHLISSKKLFLEIDTSTRLRSGGWQT